MAFNFDVEEAARSLATTPAKPTPSVAKVAKAANPTNIAERISGISRISKPQTAEPDPEAWDYTLADLAEMDRLLRELADLEKWAAADLEQKLDERRKMAPGRVRAALAAIRQAHRLALGPWPEGPQKRSKIVLCVLQGGKVAA